MSAKPLILTGSIKELNPVEAGNLKTSGTAYLKQTFILTTNEQYSRDIYIIAWNKVIEQLSRVKKTDIINVYFNVKCYSFVTKEGELKYNTEIAAWKVEIDFKATTDNQYIQHA
jgi:hypothetical protein